MKEIITVDAIKITAMSRTYSSTACPLRRLRELQGGTLK
jgi:hypothetical protein